MTVEELVRAAAKGRTDAFEELVRLHEKKVYALTLRMCGNPEDARDAAQEGLPSFRGEAGFSTWLYRLASNAAIDQLRRNRRQREEASLDAGEMDTPDQSPGPQEAAEGSELQRAVADGLASLSEDHRRILLLREYQELSYDEIAQTLDMDLGTVKSRISRARRALRKILLESGNLSGYLPSKQTEKEGRS